MCVGYFSAFQYCCVIKNWINYLSLLSNPISVKNHSKAAQTSRVQLLYSLNCAQWEWEGGWDCAGCTSFLCLCPVLSLEKLFEKWGACPWAIWLGESSDEKSSGARKEVEMALAAWLLRIGNQSPGEPVKDVSSRENLGSGQSFGIVTCPSWWRNSLISKVWRHFNTSMSTKQVSLSAKKYPSKQATYCCSLFHNYNRC